MKIKTLSLAFATVLLLAGCSRYKYVETEIKTKLKHQDQVQMEISVSRGRTGLSLFVKNKTNEDIEVNWDKTLFIKNGRTNGTFLFEGVTYSKRNDHKANSIIFANGTLEKVLYPNANVFYSKGWTHLAIKEKVVGISVFFEGKNNSFRETTSISIERIKLK